MPAFPCVACKNLVDTNDVVCRKCNDRQPFECSKCGVRLAGMEIHEVDKLTFKKSLFCSKCGQENAVVPCHQCNTSIIRSVGKTRVGSKGTELIYHEDCWKLYEKQARISKLITMIGTPVVSLLVLLLFGFSTGNWGKSLEIMVGAAAAVLVLGVIASPRG